MNKTPLELATEKLSPLGYSLIDTNVGTMLGNLKSVEGCIDSVCAPMSSHQAIVDSIQWLSGQLIMVKEESPRFIIMESFFMLESADIPRSILSLRDYVDYGLEAKLKQVFATVGPMIGPQWNYLYGVENLEGQLKDNSLLLFSPLLGNSINSRTDDLNLLLTAHVEIKELIANECPIPIMYRFPDGLTMGLKEYIYDLCNHKWYSLTVHAPFSDVISLVEFASTPSGSGGKLSLAQHRYNEAKIVETEVDLDSVEIEIVEVEGEFGGRWRLPTLALAFA